ncbi:MAG TPA: DUF6730 family protein [Arenibacter sp.]|nr:DUF6730 family protein [Arenibacter sp.]
MAKLDEIAELLTEEIKGFENSVDRMEKLKKFLMEYKVQADTTNIDFILKRYNDHQKKTVEEQHRLMANAVRSIKDSMVFPKWAVKLFGALLIVVFLVLGFSIHKVSRIPELERAAHKKGENRALIHFRAFFKANPEADEVYREWTQTDIKK